MDGVCVMARGGRSVFDVEYSDFKKSLEVLMHHVERGTKKATQNALDEILDLSLKQVPRKTNTLSKSAYSEVRGSYSNFEGIVGYGGNGDPINPITGQRASDYMVAVHEDLSAVHPIGKAKFLEDPVRSYQARYGPAAAKTIRDETGM